MSVAANRDFPQAIKLLWQFANDPKRYFREHAEIELGPTLRFASESFAIRLPDGLQFKVAKAMLDSLHRVRHETIVECLCFSVQSLTFACGPYGEGIPNVDILILNPDQFCMAIALARAAVGLFESSALDSELVFKVFRVIDHLLRSNPSFLMDFLRCDEAFLPKAFAVFHPLVHKSVVEPAPDQPLVGPMFVDMFRFIRNLLDRDGGRDIVMASGHAIPVAQLALLMFGSTGPQNEFEFGGDSPKAIPLAWALEEIRTSPLSESLLVRINRPDSISRFVFQGKKCTLALGLAAGVCASSPASTTASLHIISKANQNFPRHGLISAVSVMLVLLRPNALRHIARFRKPVWLTADLWRMTMTAIYK